MGALIHVSNKQYKIYEPIIKYFELEMLHANYIPHELIQNVKHITKDYIELCNLNRNLE